MKRALVTGITGQDGSYLAELLLQKGYQVFGFSRQDSWYRPNNASHLSDRIEVLFGDAAEGVDLARAVQQSRPDEIYNLASQSRPGDSWSRPADTLLVNGLAAVRLFEAVRHNCPDARVYQASSSEMFGHTQTPTQDETTPFDPVNPYAAAKVYAHQMASIYRESYGLAISCGILFNHESERRPLSFLTQKIAHGAACAKLGIDASPALNERGRPIVEGGRLALGNLDVARDWGYAPDYVRAMWLILQRGSPASDYVIGTGQLSSVQVLCELAFGHVGVDWRERAFRDPQLARPAETGTTLANPTKARIELGWQPSIGIREMIERMVDHQVDLLSGDRRSRHG